MGQHGPAPRLGAQAELSAEGGSGAHRAPGTRAPAFGAVCLVLISASPATQGAGAPRPLPAPHPRAHSRRSTARPKAGRWLQTDRDAAGKTHEGAGPSQGRGVPLDFGQQPRGRTPKGEETPLLDVRQTSGGEKCSRVRRRDFGSQPGETAHIERKLGFTAAGINNFRFLSLFLTGKQLEAIV